MDTPSLILFLDAALVAPFRWLEAPLPAYWLGSTLLGLLAAGVGRLCLGLARRVNRRALRRAEARAEHYGGRTTEALRQGDAAAYRALNRLGNEAFGRAFFLQLGTGVAALWPLPAAAAWLALRFEGLRLPLFGLGSDLSYTAPLLLGFVAGHLALVLLLSRLRRRRETPRQDRTPAPLEVAQ